jgi:hypothetical protein
MPFSVHAMAWSGEHRALVVEEFIQNGGSPIMTQRALRIRFALGRRDSVPDKKNSSQLCVELKANRLYIKKEIYWPTSDRNRTGNWPL